ncbi:hypothetical protein Tco_0721834 [Tanacetum coccineum]
MKTSFITRLMIKHIHPMFQMEECHKLLTNQIDLVNPEGHRIVLDISNLLPFEYLQGQQRAYESYQTKLNLEQPNWDASDIPFKEDYTIVFKPRAVIYRDRDDNRKMMRIDEVHKFSDGTLTRIKEKLDFMVKDFKLFKFNKGMENRKWTEDDKRRSEEFIEVIKRTIKIRRTFESGKLCRWKRPTLQKNITTDLVSRTE